MSGERTEIILPPNAQLLTARLEAHPEIGFNAATSYTVRQRWGHMNPSDIVRQTIVVGAPIEQSTDPDFLTRIFNEVSAGIELYTAETKYGPHPELSSHFELKVGAITETPTGGESYSRSYFSVLPSSELAEVYITYLSSTRKECCAPQGDFPQMHLPGGFWKQGLESLIAFDHINDPSELRKLNDYAAMIKGKTHFSFINDRQPIDFDPS